MTGTRFMMPLVAALLLPGCALTSGRHPGSVLEIWNHATGGFVDSAPAVASGIVFTGSWDNGVYALDLQTGALRWKFDAGDFVDASPVIDGSRLYACSWNRRVTCLDARSGRPLWRFEMPASPFDDHRQSTPSISGANILVGGFDGVLYALDRETGKRSWELATGGPIRGRPDPAGYVGSEDGHLHAFDPVTGARRWKVSVGGAITGSPSLVGGVVWFGCRNGQVYGVSADNGAIVRRYDAGSRIEYSSPLVVESTLYIGDCGGTLHALRLSDGRPSWRFRAGAPIYSSPSVAGGALVFGDNEGVVHFLDPHTGSELATYRAGGAVQAISTAPDGSVLCGSRDRRIYRLKFIGGCE